MTRAVHRNKHAGNIRGRKPVSMIGKTKHELKASCGWCLTGRCENCVWVQGKEIVCPCPCTSQNK